MFKYFLISIAFVPALIGILAAKRRMSGRSALTVTWVSYAVLWFGILYYLRYRWGG